METKLEVINEQEVLGKQFRIYGTAEQPLFLAKDVAEWIEYSKTSQGYYNVSKMLMAIDEDEKVTITIGNSDGKPHKQWFLTEDGLYEVLMQSRKPIAKQFKKKVKEILRTIRKHGAYMTDNVLEQALADPRAMAQILINLADEKEKNRQLEEANKKKDEQIAIIQPKADYVEDALKTTGGTFTLTQLCDLHGEDILSAKRVNKFLEEDGVTHGKQHRPDQRFIDACIFSYQIPEYGPNYNGFRSKKLELRLRPEGLEKLAKEYIPACVECVRAEKEQERAKKNREKAFNKAIKTPNDKNKQKFSEATDELSSINDRLDGIRKERRNAIWNMLNEEPVRLIG